MSPGQAALVRATGGAPANIRQEVDQEARVDAGNDSFIDRLLYWRKPDTQPFRRGRFAGSQAIAGQCCNGAVSRERRDTDHQRQERTAGFRSCSAGCSQWPNWRITRRSGIRRPLSAQGSGQFSCGCGQSLLIAGYEPQNFLGIAIQCAACGRISETPGLPEGAQPPANVTLVERGAEHPPRDRRQRDRPDQPRGNGAPRGVPSTARHRRRSACGQRCVARRDGNPTAKLDERAAPPAPHSYQQQPLAWAVAHFRQRLRDPEWTSFADSADSTAAAVIAAFRDLFASWGHHPLFGAMIASRRKPRVFAACDGDVRCGKIADLSRQPGRCLCRPRVPDRGLRRFSF